MVKMEMIELKDNTKYPLASENIKEWHSLQDIANYQISELLDEKGNNLLIYPHSFCECDDEIGKQCILLLPLRWKEGKQSQKDLLETGNVVGFIGINNQSISIHSRFSGSAKEDFFLHYMLQKVLCLNIVKLKHNTTEEQTFNFLLYLFPKLLNEALTQGIYKEYQRNEYNNANVRSTIDINRHFKKNLPFNGSIAYRTREFSHDNHVTELIRHTIEYIKTKKIGKSLLEKDAETRISVSQIISATSRYSKHQRNKIIKGNLKVMNHPYFTRYTPLQKLCLRILRNEETKYGHKKNEIYGILIDVSYLWEEYLATILTKKGFKHPNNKKGTGRIYLAKGNAFPRYPDFYNKESDGTIIDAKYKQQIDRRNDINQMLGYMYGLKGKQGIFIKPDQNNNPTQTYQLHGYGSDNNAELCIYSFSIPQNADNYEDFEKQINKSEDLLRTEINSIAHKSDSSI